jgi:hypothetical protein
MGKIFSLPLTEKNELFSEIIFPDIQKSLINTWDTDIIVAVTRQWAEFV